MELARIRLRGLYAVVAGVLVLFVIPYTQGALLASQGYTQAVAPITTHRDFAPLLAWIVQHPGADRAVRLLELVPFLLIVVLPPSLRLVLWEAKERGGQVARLAGQAGFALFLVAGAAGVLTSASAAAAYAAARSATARAVAVNSFVTGYTIETLLARVLGGLLIALFVLLVSLRIAQSRILPTWLVYVGLVVGALLGATGLLFALAPMQAETPTSALAHFGLAIWLIAMGAQLMRLHAVEDAPSAPIG
ncbi:MAG: hypothetical protein IVW57_07520 [Ktedonobacterales bacterium]|nr:hypothetical protein [Ktedonobacterales bacterium]